jgi:hypothetical protein
MTKGKENYFLPRKVYFCDTACILSRRDGWISLKGTEEVLG